MSGYKIQTHAGHDPALSEFLPMLYSDFMKSLRYGNDWYKLIDSRRYYEVYKQVINQLLSRAQSLVRLAILNENPYPVLGWSLSEPQKLHYVYVKEDMRKQGIGSALLPEEFDQVTHLTKIGQAIRKAKYRHVIFDPFS